LQVRIRLFAIHRERVGSSQLLVHLDNQATVADLVVQLAQQYPELATLSSTARYAVNREYAPTTQILQDGDEVALIPPVAGGQEPW